MANILYRGAAAPSATNTAGAANRPLTNDEIDKNLYALNSTKLEGTVGIANGGTNITSYTIGDILYASGANTLSKLAKGSDGQVLKLSGGVPVWGTDNDTIYSLPGATSTDRGGVKVGYASTGKNYAVQLSNEQMYVNVPWTDTVYSLPGATSTDRGGVKVGYTSTGKNYAVQLSNEQMYVNVPWTDTVYTLPLATNTVRGGVQIGYTTSGRNYAVQLSGEQMYVNVPWTDTVYSLPTASATVLGGIKVGSNLSIDANGILSSSYVNTTYSNGTGLSLSGTTFSVDYGSTSTTACRGDDSRLSDARTPTAHTHAASDITSGTIATARLGSGTANTSTFLRGDNSWAVVSTTDTNYYPTAFSWSDGTTSGPTGTLSGTGMGNVSFSAIPSASGSVSGVVNTTTQTFAGAKTFTSDLYCSGDITAFSDIKLKTDLEVIQNALFKVSQLTGYTYTRIDSGDKQTGIVAQDLEKVLPEAVGKSGEYLTVAYGNLVGLLVEAIKELNVKVEDLQKQLANK